MPRTHIFSLEENVQSFVNQSELTDSWQLLNISGTSFPLMLKKKKIHLFSSLLARMLKCEAQHLRQVDAQRVGAELS